MQFEEAGLKIRLGGQLDLLPAGIKRNLLKVTSDIKYDNLEYMHHVLKNA